MHEDYFQVLSFGISGIIVGECVVFIVTKESEGRAPGKSFLAIVRTNPEAGVALGTVVF